MACRNIRRYCRAGASRKWALVVNRFAVYDVYFHNNPAHSPIPPLWTMPIELLGSVFLVILLMTVGRTRIRFVAYLVAIASIWLWQPYISLFIVGITISEYIGSGASNFVKFPNMLGFMCIAASAIATIFMPGTPYDTPYALSAALMVFGVVNYAPAQRFLALPLSRWMGKISFPLYLLHHIVLFSLGTRLRAHLTPGDHWASAAIDITVVAASVAFAALFSFIDGAGISVSRTITRRVSLLMPNTRNWTRRLPRPVDLDQSAVKQDASRTPPPW